MIPYFVVLALSLIFMNAYQKNHNSSVYLIFCAITLILLIGLRDQMVGTDTAGYCREFLSVKEYSGLDNPWQYFSTEKGFVALNLMLAQITDHYYVFLTTIGTIGIGCTLYSISINSESRVLSLFLYIALGYYLFGFAATRQFIAMSIYMLSFSYLLKGDFKRYCIVVIVAALFHQTVLIAIPLYYFFRMTYSKKTLALVVVGGVVVGFLIPRIMTYAATVEERYAVYTEYSGGGELFTLFYTVIAIFFINQRSKIKENALQRYDIYLNMLIFGSLIYLVVTFSNLYGEVTRFAAYFQIASIFIWVELYRNRKIKLERAFWITVFVVHLAYFYIYLDKIGHIAPYILNGNLD